MNDAIIMWLFAVVALELKHRAPKAHTMLVRRMPHTPSPAYSTCFQSQYPQRPLWQQFQPVFAREPHVMLAPASRTQAC